MRAWTPSFDLSFDAAVRASPPGAESKRLVLVDHDDVGDRQQGRTQRGDRGRVENRHRSDASPHTKGGDCTVLRALECTR